MSNSVIYIIIDGLSDQVARQQMGYLFALTEAGQASYYTLQCELPSLSRPLYECLLTGATPVESGIVHNGVQRRSNQVSLFDLVRSTQKTTAAAAYHWFSELYNRSPYSARRDRFTHDPTLAIQHGIFYHQDHYPDEHVFLDADYLRCQYQPDLLLIHPMNIDDAGHHFGLDSSEYRNQARQTDLLLSHYLPEWMAEGYQIIITADHGMTADKMHGGRQPCEREVPLFVIGDHFSHNLDIVPRQKELCGCIASLMGIANHHKPICKALLKETLCLDG
ncbi:alkaline phosphatase family protein [Celerinatantimonas sp. YJH-8]|uniref:alkaline phosphatase family protein n=1 Tax=Celerinatantimonas sp. YJH-8 TaxID=3228714 RepID=UPI0038C53B61